jgi:hypothetical protein
VRPRTDATWTNRVGNTYSVDRGQGKLTSVALDTYDNFQLRFTELGELLPTNSSEDKRDHRCVLLVTGFGRARIDNCG